MNKLRIGQKLNLSILLLITSNIITGITEGKPFIVSVSVTALLTIPLFIIKKELPKQIVSWLLLLMAIIVLKDNDISNMSSFFYFLFSFYISPKSRKTYIVFSTIFSMALLYKFNILGSVPSQIIGYLAGASFMGFIYQHYIHPKKDNKYNINYKNKVIEKLHIDNTVCLIMIDYVKGYTWDEIAENLHLNVTGGRVQRIVKKEMIAKNYNNYADLCCYLTEMGIINNVDKNLITE